MSAQPAWFHRLDKIFTALRAMTSAHLDRQAVEKLFRVGQRRARQIMAALEGPRAGKRCGGVAGGSHRASGADGGQWEGNRRARVVEDLDLARQQLVAWRVRIPAAADVCARLLGDLSAGIALRLEKRQKPSEPARKEKLPESARGSKRT